MSKAADVTDDTWDTTVLQSDLPVLVDFWAEWCSPCKSMTPHVDAIADEYDGKLRVVKVNVDNASATATRYGVMSIPTFLVVKGGKEVGKTMGMQPLDNLKKLVDPHV